MHVVRVESTYIKKNKKLRNVYQLYKTTYSEVEKTDLVDHVQQNLLK